MSECITSSALVTEFWDIKAVAESYRILGQQGKSSLVTEFWDIKTDTCRILGLLSRGREFRKFVTPKLLQGVSEFYDITAEV